MENSGFCRQTNGQNDGKKENLGTAKDEHQIASIWGKETASINASKHFNIVNLNKVLEKMKVGEMVKNTPSFHPFPFSVIFISQRRINIKD
jgi:hypothetical protein